MEIQKIYCLKEKLNKATRNGISHTYENSLNLNLKSNALKPLWRNRERMRCKCLSGHYGGGKGNGDGFTFAPTHTFNRISEERDSNIWFRKLPWPPPSADLKIRPNIPQHLLQHHQFLFTSGRILLKVICIVQLISCWEMLLDIVSNQAWRIKQWR